VIEQVAVRSGMDSNVAELNTPDYLPLLYCKNGGVTQTPRQIIRGQDTKIPQSSGPPKKVGDEAVHKELGDKMERAATTASSLEAEQDIGKNNRTQSMATLNEPSP
ncbi:hypothetical protein Tco_0170525, partial [Tanacetum coccineum]